MILVFTKTAVVLPRALHCAIRKYFQMKSSSAVQLPPPENSFEVR